LLVQLQPANHRAYEYSAGLEAPRTDTSQPLCRLCRDGVAGRECSHVNRSRRV